MTIVGVLVLAGIAATTPERQWPRIGRAIGPLVRRLGISGFAQRRLRIAAIAGDRLAEDADAILSALHASHVERNLQVIRCHLPGGWRPRIRLEGAEHIDAALAAGNGAVLWDSHFAFSSLVTKMALWQAGHAVSHLSHPRHGFSRTRFGMRWLNWVRTSIEERYLRERVVMGLDSPKAALQLLDARLAENKLVSVTARAESRRPTAVPFLAERMYLAPGAPELAYARRAALMPVFTVREADGAFHVLVDQGLRPRDGESRADFLDRAFHGYAQRLESHVMRAPGQWLGWFDV